MNGKMKKFVSAIELLGWTVYEDKNDKTLELLQSSPAGEDFGIIVSSDYEHFMGDVFRSYANFDEEEHVTMWLEAKRNGVYGVPDLYTLVDDAESIKDMLERLWLTINKVEHGCDAEKAPHEVDTEMAFSKIHEAFDEMSMTLGLYKNAEYEKVKHDLELLQRSVAPETIDTKTSDEGVV